MKNKTILPRNSALANFWEAFKKESLEEKVAGIILIGSIIGAIITPIITSILYSLNLLPALFPKSIEVLGLIIFSIADGAISGGIVSLLLAGIGYGIFSLVQASTQSANNSTYDAAHDNSSPTGPGAGVVVVVGGNDTTPLLEKQTTGVNPASGNIEHPGSGDEADDDEAGEFQNGHGTAIVGTH